MSNSPDQVNQNFMEDCEMEVDNENCNVPAIEKETRIVRTSDDLAAEALAADMDEWIVFDPRDFSTEQMMHCFHDWLLQNQPSEVSR